MRVRYENAKARPGTLGSKGERNRMHPAQVRGPLRRRRSVFFFLLLSIFLLLPVLKVGGAPAVFLDVGRREFHLFGYAFWASDAPLVFPLVGGFFVFLMGLTTVLGRAWCGWACPQTVTIDFIYARVERWIEGDSHARKQLDASPWGAGKSFKKATKWIIFFLISAFLAHAFLAYFVSWAGWLDRYRSGFSEAGASLVMLILSTLVFLFDFGWFRDQFCIVACPYGRWQTVWMDNHSLVVDYDAVRGEPRRGAAAFGQSVGDCVSCGHCVQACPTGVDIRGGVQMECIACTACIDACNEVMLNLGKKPGLIRYTSFAQLRDPARRERPFRIVPRARIFLYGLAIIVLAGGFWWGLSHRGPLWIYLKRLPGPPYVSSSDGGSLQVINGFKASVRNLRSETERLTVRAPEIPGFTLDSGPQNEVLAPGEQRDFVLLTKYVQVAAGGGRAPRNVKLSFGITGEKSGRQEVRDYEIHFMSP